MVYHTINMDNSGEYIEIFRHFDQRRVLFTKYLLDDAVRMGFDDFSKRLGEDLILDNELLRDAFKI